MEHRKGARKVSDIPAEVIELLHKGKLQTVNLTEWLAVDHLVLLENVLDELGFGQESQPILQRLNDVSEKKIMKLIPAIAQEWQLVLDCKLEVEQSRVFTALAQHRSDSVRCWAAYIIGLNQSLSLSQKLMDIRPFAADDHFGVREISWMALRESVITELDESIKFLENWVHDQDPNIRRFAIELTRPHGVWAKHITALKENPAIALPLLEPLRSDPAKYVQDSVSNWLNDASKSNPDWVLQLSEKWLISSDSKETKRIVTRATRSITDIS
ncbi:DNA alkylation repair protein [Acinetobacter sp. CUI P1]|nr:DNA alkylation repair protein [Acinetobacter sp. CUI P1]